MKNLLTILALLAAFCHPERTSAQTEKGATPLNPQSAIANPKSTYAVVIGISDYQDPGIPDLRFAHRDADAPAFWLQSPASGSMAPENINQFTNWMATAARFAADTGRTSFKESEKQGTSECH